MNHQTKTIEAWVRFVGQSLELPALQLDEDGHAFIELSGGAYLHFHSLAPEAPQGFVLVGALGHVPPAAEPAILRLLMAGNLSWRETAGGALAFDPEERRAMLIIRLDLTPLDEEAFAQRVFAAIAAAENWAEQISSLLMTVQSETENAADINHDLPFRDPMNFV